MEAKQEAYVGIEAGGTTFVAAISVSSVSSIVERVVYPTRSPSETIGNVLDWLDSMSKRYKFICIGVASFGPICLDKEDEKYGFITTTPKPMWADTDILGPFRKYNVPIGFDTDVNGAALSEIEFGKHGNIHSCAYITVGTGIGAGVVVEGKAVHGNLHPEAGHMMSPVLQGDEFEGSCPYHGKCIEGMTASGALSRRAGRPASELAQLEDNDDIWNASAYYLAHLCASITYVASPEVIVLGGGIMKRRVIFDHVRDYFTSIINGYVIFKRPVKDMIVPSVFANNAGMIGALNLGRLELNKMS